MIAEIKRSPPMYKPPSEFKIRRSLLDDAYERVKKDRAEKFANAFSKGFAL